MVVDRRIGNSREELGISVSVFDLFWIAYRAVFLPDGAADERRQGDINI